jgi:acetolactate synthase-1/2/3 large subunit
MNGAEYLIQASVNAGIEICFSNPGTTELPLVNALDKVPGMRSVLGLFEGVCTGAADGYARMKGKPAMTLLHLGPGLANGIANLHNAKRAKTPILNIVGEHATWHRPHDPLLAMDIEAIASTVSGWVRTSISADRLAKDVAEAIDAANQGQVATLIVPSDCQWTQINQIETLSPQPGQPAFDASTLQPVIDKLRRNRKKTALVLGGPALSREGLMASARIGAATGCDLLCGTFPSRMERGAGLPAVRKIPYLPEMAVDMLKPYERVVFAGEREPVAFFGYNGLGSRFLSDSQEKIHLDAASPHMVSALTLIADALSAEPDPDPSFTAPYKRPQIRSGALDGVKAGEVIAALQPENAIVVDEAITNSLAYFDLTAGCPEFTLLSLTGGSIGQGPPCATGAALACPKRPVINFQADGSAMYTVQSLWTQAKENLNIVTLICSNRGYDILKLEQARAGILNPGPCAVKMTDLSGIDWVKIAQSQGVPGVAVSTAEALAEELEKALTADGPRLIEMRL